MALCVARRLTGSNIVPRLGTARVLVLSSCSCDVPIGGSSMSNYFRKGYLADVPLGVKVAAKNSGRRDTMGAQERPICRCSE